MFDPDAGEPSPAAEPDDLGMAPCLLSVNASGAAGDDGRDGNSYSGQRAARGQHGRRGGNATPARPGQSAGDAQVRLIERPGNMMQIEGVLAQADGRERQVDEPVVIGELGYIELLAQGGHGGGGGRGGDGEDGGKGHDGSDATRWSAGGDGGPGGDGGDGGHGTSGEAGGNGGKIVVQVDHADTHLLMLVRHNASGGRGGTAGANGQGGSGGPGGDGGRSYSWTTTSTEHYTDAQGNRQTRTRTHHHSNPGGSDGPHGRRGRDGDAYLQPGADGSDGDYRIQVDIDGQTAQYRSRYEVEISSYQLHLEDHFAEPESILRVSQFEVRNSGGMPTPERCPVVLRLADGPWVTADAAELVLPEPLRPGDSYLFDGQELTARVPDIDAVPVGEPLRDTDRVNPLAIQSGVERRFSNRHPRQTFSVAFAAEMASIRSLESLTPGRAARLVVTIVNNSQYDLGAESGNRRRLKFTMELGNHELAVFVMLLDQDGRHWTWPEGYSIEIPRLASGASTTIELIVGILPGAPAYQRAELTAALHLGRIHHPDQLRQRHCRLFPVRIAQAYEFDPEADILLIANHGTTTEEKSAWESVAKSLHKTINIWDISLNDACSLSELLAHGDNLLRDFHGKTIILSNAPFRTSLGDRYGDQFVSQMDLINAAESHGIRWLVLNDQQHDLTHLFRERLVPTDGEPEYRYSSQEAFLKAKPTDDVEVLFDQVRELVEHGSKAAEPNPLNQTSEITIHGVRGPKAKRLKRQAAKLQRHLENRAPGRRYVVKYQLPSERDTPKEQWPKHEGFFFRHETQGWLTVMPTLGDAHPNLVVVDATADQIHAPEYIQSPGVVMALMQAFSFEDKIFLLDAQLREIAEAHRIDPATVAKDQVQLAQRVVDSLLFDLACEQAAILKTPWKSLPAGSLFKDGLVQLEKLAKHPFRLTSADAALPHSQLLARLIAGIEFLGDHASRWYESRIFPWGWWRRGPALRRATLESAEALTRNVFGVTGGQPQQLIAPCREHFQLLMNKVRRQSRVGKKAAARLTLRQPLEIEPVRTDLEQAIPRVLSHRSWQNVRQAEDEREQARQSLQTEKEQNRTQYLIAMAGQPLAHVDGQWTQALQPFVRACGDAFAQRRQQAELRKQALPLPNTAAITTENEPDGATQRAQQLEQN